MNLTVRNIQTNIKPNILRKTKRILPFLTTGLLLIGSVTSCDRFERKQNNTREEQNNEQLAKQKEQLAYNDSVLFVRSKQVAENSILLELPLDMQIQNKNEIIAEQEQQIKKNTRIIGNQEKQIIKNETSISRQEKPINKNKDIISQQRQDVKNNTNKINKQKQIMEQNKSKLNEQALLLQGRDFVVTYKGKKYYLTREDYEELYRIINGINNDIKNSKRSSCYSPATREEFKNHVKVWEHELEMFNYDYNKSGFVMQTRPEKTNTCNGHRFSLRNLRNLL